MHCPSPGMLTCSPLRFSETLKSSPSGGFIFCWIHANSNSPAQPLLLLTPSPSSSSPPQRSSPGVASLLRKLWVPVSDSSVSMRSGLLGNQASLAIDQDSFNCKKPKSNALSANSDWLSHTHTQNGDTCTAGFRVSFSLPPSCVVSPFPNQMAHFLLL